MKSRVLCGLLLICTFTGGLVAAAASSAEHTLVLYTRARVEDPAESGQFKLANKTVNWDAQKTAIVICDMWNEHWCRGATGRVAEMAPRMNEVISEARKKGVLIIHAPSGTLKTYEGTPGRELARQAPKVEPRVPLQDWCHLDEAREGALPIDDSDGGCDCDPPCPKGHPWTSQIATLKIRPGDAITDSAEAYYLLQQRGIDNVIIMGVHTNMCVLGRPFGIRQMVAQGKNVLLMRDMTDTMYNSRQSPQVSHVRGTELVLEHIEKQWCPTITSSDFLAGPAFRFAEDERPHVAFIVSDDHYQADKTLPELAQLLRERYGCYCTVQHGQGTSDIPALGELEDADCLIVYVRRLTLPKEQLAKVRAYVASGKPVVGMRTASHAFCLRDKAGPEGTDQWPEFDAEVLGGNYKGHLGNEVGSDVAVVADQAGHPILAGVRPAKWHSAGSLYQTAPVAPGATVLMTGSVGDQVEPLTWTRTHQGGRVVYTGLGHPEDFNDPQVVTLLINAIHWAMDRPVP